MAVHKTHPAETSSAGVVVVIIALTQLLGVNLSDQQLQALVVLVGVLPAVVTLFVTKRRSG